MRFHELVEYKCHLNHDPFKLVSLFVRRGEYADCMAMVRRFGGESVGVEKTPVIPAVFIKIFCPTADAALELGAAWLDYSDTSPHRPIPAAG